MRLGIAHIKAVARSILYHHSFDYELPKIVLYAGSNGKGSNIAIANYLLRANNVKVGCFTSPHLIDLRERIKINDQIITTAQLQDAIHFVDKLLIANCMDNSISFFEYMFLIAITSFRQHKLEVILIEVGIGGRLDATNVLNPDISVFASICLEHTQILGNTLSKIAYEKAGIARFNKPALMTIDNAELQRELKYKGATIINCHNSSNYLKNYYDAAKKTLELLAIKSAKTPSFEDATEGLKNTHKARFQIEQHCNLEFIIDVAHNYESAKALVQNIEALPNNKQYHCLLAMAKDKDIDKFIEALAPIVSSCSVLDIDHSRLMSSQELSSRINTILPNAEVKNYPSFDTYVADINNSFNNSETAIIVTGSFYIAGPAIKWLQTEHNL